MRAQLSLMLSSSVCGLGYMHSDIGGTYGTGDPELYRRWMQMGVFSPIMRAYGIASGSPP